eukprot:c47524_g1_i1 orf=1-186(-)
MEKTSYLSTNHTVMAGKWEMNTAYSAHRLNGILIVERIHYSSSIIDGTSVANQIIICGALQH